MAWAPIGFGRVQASARVELDSSEAPAGEEKVAIAERVRNEFRMQEENLNMMTSEEFDFAPENQGENRFRVFRLANLRRPVEQRLCQTGQSEEKMFVYLPRKIVFGSSKWLIRSCLRVRQVVRPGG